MEGEHQKENQASPSENILDDLLAKIGQADLPPPSDVKSDKQEAKQLYGSDQQREENLKREFHRGFIWLLRSAIVAFVLVFLVRVLHFVLPDNIAQNCGSYLPHGWLTDTQLQTVDKFFFSGTLGALITKYLGPITGRKPTTEKE